MYVTFALYDKAVEWNSSFTFFWMIKLGPDMLKPHLVGLHLEATECMAKPCFLIPASQPSVTMLPTECWGFYVHLPLVPQTGFVFLLQRPSFILLLGLVASPTTCPALRPKTLPAPAPSVPHLFVCTAISIGQDSFIPWVLIRFFSDLPCPHFLLDRCVTTAGFFFLVPESC